MLICKEYVEKMGYSLNREMQLLSRKNGRWGIKEEILGQIEKEQLSETSLYIKPLSYVNHAPWAYISLYGASHVVHAISL